MEAQNENAGGPKARPQASPGQARHERRPGLRRQTFFEAPTRAEQTPASASIQYISFVGSHPIFCSTPAMEAWRRERRSTSFRNGTRFFVVNAMWRTTRARDCGMAQIVPPRWGFACFLSTYPGRRSSLALPWASLQPGLWPFLPSDHPISSHPLSITPIFRLLPTLALFSSRGFLS